MKLQGKVAFITDADSESGKSLIDKLAREGAQLVLNSASAGAAIQANLEYCRSVGASCILTHMDLSKEMEVEEVLEGVIEQTGSMDVLIHNSNLVIPAKVADCSEELFWRMMDANVKSAFISTRAVGKRMQARQAGKVIYVSSIHDEKPTGSAFLYSVAKGALQMLCREAALELGRNNVQVNVIEMGPVEGDDDVFQSDISNLYRHYRTKVPNACLGTYQDLANLVVFLASDESCYMNGSNIRMDGGFVLHYQDFKMKTDHRPVEGFQ